VRIGADDNMRIEYETSIRKAFFDFYPGAKKQFIDNKPQLKQKVVL
jgi:hypothetical protein